MAAFWKTVLDRLEADERVLVVVVVDHSVHSPGTTGAKMAVFADGSTIGTIGGGIMELEIVRTGRESLPAGDGSPRRKKLHHRKEGPGEKSGLICAGFQTNVYMVLDRTEHLDVLKAIVKAERKDQSRIFEISPEGFRIVPTVGRDARVQHHLLELDDRWWYRESVRNLSRVAILGGGHCGLALSRLMHGLGYHVSIFDTRPRVSTMLENDYTDEKHIVGDFVEAAGMIRCPERTNVVVMTTELASDVRALLGAAGISFPFVGVMGSKAKIASIRKALAEVRVDQEFLDNLVAPVGLSVGSSTPEEIAVSVAAQLLQVRSESINARHV